MEDFLQKLLTEYFPFLAGYALPLIALASIMYYFLKRKLEEKFRLQTELILENLKSKNIKATAVHQIQFDTEFKAYKEIWKQLCIVTSAFNVLKLPNVLNLKSKEEFENLRVKRMHDFFTANTDFEKTINYNKPFYPENIYNALLDFAKSMTNESIQIIEANKNSELLERFFNNENTDIDRIKHQVNAVSNAIRDRILSIS